MKVKFKRLNENAVSPYRATEGDCGYDLTATSVVYCDKTHTLTYHTGIAIEMEEGYGAFIYPRSSVYKKHLQLANSVGVIDQKYRNELLVKFRVLTEDRKTFDYIFKNLISDKFYNVGDRVAQLVFKKMPTVELEEVESLNETDRGGFGSTGA